MAQETLGAERGMTMLELAERLGNVGFRWLVETCAPPGPGGERPLDDPLVLDRLAAFETEVTGLRAMCRDLVERHDAGTSGPADASVVKLYYSELLQRMTGFGADIAGLAARTTLRKPLSSGWESGAWVLDFIGSWEWTIPGVTSEIQRTIIGWPGLEAPSVLDGAGATFAEVAVVLQEMGRAATRSPYLGAVVLGVGALNLLEPGSDRDRLLTEIASGATVPCVALPGEEDTTPFRIEQTPDGLRLNGRASFVPDAPGTDRVLFPVLDPTGTPVIVNLPPQAPGLTLTPQPVLDATRSLALVTTDGAEMSEPSIWRFNGDPRAAVRRLLDRAATAIACDSLGLSEAMLDATVAYAGVREQFGRPIGSFQAVKHACADMLVQISVSRGLVAAAVRDLAEGSPDASMSTSMAKSYTCAAAVDIAGKAMQLHGGMGYTWESGIHVYLKRANLNRSLFGSPTVHRKRLSARYG